MSFDSSRAFDVRNGVAVKGGVGFYSGAGTPVGCQAPLNSTYRDKDSLNVWKKTGPLDTEWTLQSSSDPFERALFDGCTPLFDKDEATGEVQLLEDC